MKDRAVAREVDRTKAQADNVVMEQRKVKALEDDIHVYAQEAAKQRKLIYQLEKERERLGSDAGKYLSEGAAREWSTVVIVIVIFIS